MPIEVLLTEASAPVLRAGDFHATAGGTGVALPADLRVRALDVPGTSVRVVRGPSGSAAMRDPRPSRGAQSWVTVASESELVPVPATDSSGPATRYIIEYVDDQNSPGAYFACVDSLVPYEQIPHLWLATINQPPSTATITNDIIDGTPRKVAKPLELTRTHPYAQRAGDPGQVLNSTNPVGEYFPNAGWVEWEIPWFATEMDIECTWSAISYDAGLNPYGRCWMEWGPSTGSSTRMYKTQEYGFNGSGASENGFWACYDTVKIPEKDANGDQLRGTVQRFIQKAYYTSPDAGAEMNGLSGTNIRVTFKMVAD